MFRNRIAAVLVMSVLVIALLAIGSARVETEASDALSLGNGADPQLADLDGPVRVDGDRIARVDGLEKLVAELTTGDLISETERLS